MMELLYVFMFNKEELINYACIGNQRVKISRHSSRNLKF